MKNTIPSELELPPVPHGQFSGKVLRLQVAQDESNFFTLHTTSALGEGYKVQGLGLASLQTIQKNLSGDSWDVIIAISAKPVFFYNGAPFALENISVDEIDHFSGILSGDILAAMERRVGALFPPNMLVPLVDAFSPPVHRLAFPTGSDGDSDVPIKFFSQLSKAICDKQRIFLIGDSDAPGPLATVLSAVLILLDAKQSAQSNTQSSFNFERISILAGSLSQGFVAKEHIDGLFSSIYLQINGLAAERIRNPIERIIKHHASGNLDGAATWLGRYASLILLFLWHCHGESEEFIKWACTTIPDVVFGQLQAFARRPASWWLFRPLPGPKVCNENSMLLHTFHRIQSNLPLLLHSSALIMKRDTLPSLDVSHIENQSVDGTMIVGLAGARALSDLFQSLCKKKVLWLDVRGEPYVYIGDVDTFSLRDEATAHRHLRAFVGAPSIRLTNIEARVAEDITRLLEAVNGDEEANQYFFFEETEGRHLKPIAHWPVGPVYSPHQLAMKIGGDNCEWQRIALPGDSIPSLANVSMILDAIGHHRDSQVVIQCRSGHRGSRAAFVATLVHLVKGGKRSFAIESKITYPSALAPLIRAIPQGKLAWSVVSQLLPAFHHQAPEESTPRRKLVVQARLSWTVAIASFLLDTERIVVEKNSINGIDASLYEFSHSFSSKQNSAHCASTDEDENEQNNGLGQVFIAWLQRHEEITHMLMESSQTVVEQLAAYAHNLKNEGASINAWEHHHILKDDHFIGCHRIVNPNIPRVEGAPNFRALQWKEWLIAGTGIPSATGWHEITKSHLGAASHILWVNLREEPVIYLRGLPFSIREAAKPIENVLTTGISTDDVERIETELVELLKKQLCNNPEDLTIQVHGEAEEDNCQLVTYAYRLSLSSISEVQTCREVFEADPRIVYIRLPISDEQAPLPRTFDAFANAVWAFFSERSPEKRHALFHCQMGRGRTTTGMVLCAMILEFIHGDTLHPSANHAKEMAISPQNVMVSMGVSESSDEKNGQSILQALVDIMEHGIMAKKFVDTIVDTFATIQNLRTAIWQIEDPTLKAQYLERYFYLVCFGHFLIEASPRKDVSAASFVETAGSFSRWLDSHPHITALACRIRSKSGHF